MKLTRNLAVIPIFINLRTYVFLYSKFGLNYTLSINIYKRMINSTDKNWNYQSTFDFSIVSVFLKINNCSWDYYVFFTPIYNIYYTLYNHACLYVSLSTYWGNYHDISVCATNVVWPKKGKEKKLFNTKWIDFRNFEYFS